MYLPLSQKGRGSGGWVLLLTLLAPAAQARTIYVAPGGSNANSGVVTSPLADPVVAARKAVAGDTILLRAGRYNIASTLYLAKDGLTLAAAPGEAAALQVPEGEDVSHVVVITASRVTLAGIEIRGGAANGVKVDIAAPAKSTRGVKIRNCRIADSGWDCLKTFNADELLIEGCDIGPSGLRDPSNAEGIDVIGSHLVTIRNCLIHNTATNGLYLKGGTTDGVVESCRVENLGRGAGILLGQDTDLALMRDGARYEAIRCVARNNIVLNTGGPGAGSYSGDGIRFENNTLYNVARESGGGIWIGVNGRGVMARNISIKNNIVATTGVRPLVYLLNAEGRPSIDYNLYFSPGTSGHFRIEAQGGVSTLSPSAWQIAASADAHSRLTGPSLDSTRLYQPRPGSPAINRGILLDGVVADFDGTPRPLGGAFDLGAHEFEASG